MMTEAAVRIVVRIKDQAADLMRGATVLKTYRISSAANGLGCQPGSKKTPSGILRIAAKIGEGAPLRAVFRSRVEVGEIWTPGSKVVGDLVLTRILWLEGTTVSIGVGSGPRIGIQKGL